MPNTVRNESRPGIYAKLKTVERWIEQCVCEWVIEGRSFRELEQSERLRRMAANMELANNKGRLADKRTKAQKYGLPPINPSGEIERMPTSSVWTSRVKFDCLVAAQQFCQNPNV